MVARRRGELRRYGGWRLATGALAAMLATGAALPWWQGGVLPVLAETRPYNTAPLTSFESGLGAESVVTDGTSVVWVDGNGVLFSRTLADGKETRLLETPAGRSQLALVGGVLVWVERDDAGSSIRGLRLGTGELFTIASGEGERNSPAIGIGTVVWRDARAGNWNIYAYDLDAQREFALTTVAAPRGAISVSGKNVVWEEYRSGRWSLVAYDLAERRETPLTTGTDDEVMPSVGTDALVFVRRQAGRSGGTLVLRDLASGQERQIVGGHLIQRPVIAANLVIWEDWRDGVPNIYAFDRATAKEFAIARTEDARNPAIGGTVVVWLNRGQFSARLTAVRLVKALPTDPQDPPTVTDPDVRYFAETKHNVSGAFLTFWEDNGGLAIFGYPISEEVQENGKTVQYFERARFELNPSADSARTGVVLGQLGREALLKLGWLVPEQTR